MRDRLLAAVLIAALLAAVTAFAFGLREARSANDELRGLREEIRRMNVYLGEIAY